MNVQIPGAMLEAMKSRPEKEWKALFEMLVQQKLQQVLGTNQAEELTRIQASALQIKEICNFFLAEMRR